MTEAKIPRDQAPTMEREGELMVSPHMLLALAAGWAWDADTDPKPRARALAVVNGLLTAASRAGMTHWQIAETRLARGPDSERFTVASEVCSYLSMEEFMLALVEAGFLPYATD